MTTVKSNKKEYPTFDYMIASAISSLKRVKGSSRVAVFKFIATTWPVPDKTLNTYLSRSLKRMVDQNKLKKIKASYKLTDLGKQILSPPKKSLKKITKSPKQKKLTPLWQINQISLEMWPDQEEITPSSTIITTFKSWDDFINTTKYRRIDEMPVFWTWENPEDEYWEGLYEDEENPPNVLKLVYIDSSLKVVGFVIIVTPKEQTKVRTWLKVHGFRV